MAMRQVERPWNAESPAEQGRGTQGGSWATRFEEARVEGWGAEERPHEFSRFVPPPSFCFHVVDGLSPPVKANDSQREGWRLTDEEVISQVR